MFPVGTSRHLQDGGKIHSDDEGLVLVSEESLSADMIGYEATGMHSPPPPVSSRTKLKQAWHSSELPRSVSFS